MSMLGRLPPDIVALVIVMIAVAPLIVRMFCSQNVPPLVRVVDEGASLPIQVLKQFSFLSDDMFDQGFLVVATLIISDDSSNTESYMRVYVNRSTMESAEAVVIYHRDGDTSSWKMNYLEFISQYEDGTTICTNNYASPKLFPSHGHDSSVSATTVGGLHRPVPCAPMSDQMENAG